MLSKNQLFRPSITEITDYACLDDIRIDGITDHAFIARISGVPMKAAGIADGDWLIFDPCRRPADGDIVSLIIYGQPICRRIFFESNKGRGTDKIRIRKEDLITPDLVANQDDVQIRGVFVGLVRSCRRGRRKGDYQFYTPTQAEQGMKKKESRSRNRESAGSLQKASDALPDPSAAITALGLPARVENRLVGIGMRTAQDILDIPDKEAFLAIPGIGKTTYETILASMDGYGFDVRHLCW